jgi:glycosyltransferase involved in cell wall biosynthesis
VRLAWFSPLPPIASGIADYSYEVAPLVSEIADVDVFSPRASLIRGVRAPRGVRRLPPSAFEERGDRYDAVLYHLGNNPHHEYVYRAALRRRGVVVLHDYVLHHLIAWMLVDGPRRNWLEYEELMATSYGEVGRRLADLRMRGVATDFEKFLFPLGERVIRSAAGVVVHSLDVGRRVRDVAPDVPVTVVPHHAGIPPVSVRDVDRAGARARLGLEQDRFLVGQFGYVTLPKQPAAVVRGFARLAAGHPGARLVMVGADRSGGGLQRLVDRHGVADRVRLTGFVNLERFYLYLKAVDIVVNLRYPSAGESSGTFARAMALGRATIVNDLGSFAEVPGDVALKVEVDGDQAEEVAGHLLRLADDLAFREHVEQRAREYGATVLDPRRCAALYVEAATRAARESEEVHLPT